MTTPLLVVTGDVIFGDLTRQSLEATGHFRVLVVADTRQALAVIQDEKPLLVFLDTSGNLEKSLLLGRNLRLVEPGTQFIIISDSGWHPALEELTPQGHIPKQFYLPDVLTLLEGFFALNLFPAQPQTTPIDPLNPPLPELPRQEWMNDVNRAAQHLTRLTFESSAQAALITVDSALWAYAGQLPQAAAQELVTALARFKDDQADGDLLRLIRLDTTHAEHMLYATQFAHGLVLALVFDAETSFSTIRSQANALVDSLSRKESAGEAVEVLSAINKKDAVKLDGAGNATPVMEASPSPVYSIPDASFSGFQPSAGHPQGSSPSLPVQAAVLQPDPLTTLVEGVDAALEILSGAPATDTGPLFMADLSETKPRPANERSRRIVLEPISSSVYNLTYACLLVPRFSHHYLTGDLRDRLSGWMLNLSVAYGWRLEHIAIRADYMLWMVNVPPATAPGYLMRIYRRHTSRKILAEFNRIRADNPAGDFWAPSHMIMAGSEPPSTQLITEFIEQTRHRQGLS